VPLVYGIYSVPWWCNVLVATITYVLLTQVIPSFAGTHIILEPISQALSLHAVYIAGIFLLPTPFSLAQGRTKKRLREQQTSLDSICLLTWQDFKLLVSEAYKRKDFQVIKNGQRGADGTIDIIIGKEGRTHIVQCK